MRELVIADLRHSLRIWAGSVLVIAVTQISVMFVMGMMLVGITNSWIADADLSGFTPIQNPDGSVIDAKYLSTLPTTAGAAMGMSFIIVAVVASLTVRNVVNSIVYQRRRVMALWQLAGMSERQMLGVLRAQIAVLSVAAFAIAVVVTLPLTPWLLDLMHESQLLFTPPMTTWGVFIGYAAGALLSVLVCVLAVRGVSKELRAISPLEAIRSEGVRELPMTLKKWIGTGVCAGIAVFGVVGGLGAGSVKDAMNMSLLVGLFGLVTFNVGGPVLMIGLMRAWTRLVPEHLSASWFLARKTLIASTSRSVSACGSISVAVFLFTALFAQNSGTSEQAAVFVILVGFPLGISVVGSVVLVFMAGQQREREIHLAELAGATPAQQKRQAFFEAVIVVVTGAGIGLAMVVLMSAVAQPALIAETGASSLTVGWRDFAIITGVLLVLNVVATIVPTVVAQANRERIAVPE